MATPLYDVFRAKVRDWANKRDQATVPEDILEDCIRYGADDIQRILRVPPLEFDRTFTIEASHNTTAGFSRLPVPDDLIEFIWVALINPADSSIQLTYDNVPDIRTFLNPYSEQYTRHRYAWTGLDFLVAPQLAAGDQVQLHYYRRLPAMDALYDVVPENYVLSLADADQPMLTLGGTVNLYRVYQGYNSLAVFATYDEAYAYQQAHPGTSITNSAYTGVEAWNWLRDNNEKLVMWGALAHIGAYLDNAEMEQRYTAKLEAEIKLQNQEERYRRARGGTPQVQVNAGGLI